MTCISQDLLIQAYKDLPTLDCVMTHNSGKKDMASLSDNEHLYHLSSHVVNINPYESDWLLHTHIRELEL